MVRSRWLALAVATSAALLASVTSLAAPSGWLALDGSIRALTTARDWGNEGSGGASCASGAVDVAGTRGIFNCGSPAAAGTPPNPPTLTASAVADPSIISAAFIVDPIASDTTACGAGDPTVIAGGGKNGDPIGSYSLTTQSVPAKDDLGDVYALSHVRSDNGRPELFFAAERLVNNGDSHIDFEFLQSRVTITSACAGSFAGSRTEGDLLATVDFTTGGTLAGIALYQWHCSAEPGPQPPDGTVCDPSGSTPPEHYQAVANSTVISFLVNAATIPCGGWVCRDKITGTSATIATNDFMEGGIDLHALPFTGCFNTFLPHTRTAQSFAATLKDFTGPSPLNTCRTPTSTSSSTGSTAASVPPGTAVTDAITIAAAAGFAPTGTVGFFLCGPAVVTSSGCTSGGTQVGTPRPLTAGSATSDATSATTANGRYCWRTEYTPDANSQGVYLASTHTNATTECFTVEPPTASSTPSPDPALPATGAPPAGASVLIDRRLLGAGLLALLGLTAALEIVIPAARRRPRRSVERR